MKNDTMGHVYPFTWPLIVFFFFLIFFAGNAGRQDQGSRRHSAHPEHPSQELPSAQLFAVHESTPPASLTSRYDRLPIMLRPLPLPSELLSTYRTA